MTQPTTSPSWHVAFTNPCCEQKAEMALQARGFDVFLPTFTKTARTGPRGYEKRYEVTKTLFPRYIFLIIPETRYLDARRTDGIETLVRNAGGWATVSDADMQDLRVLDYSGLLDEDPTKAPPLLPGDCAKIRTGRLANMVVRLKSLDGEERCNVLFEFIEGSSDREVNMPVANLERIEYLTGY